MIKKALLLIVILLFAIMLCACVQSDKFDFPTFADGEHIDIETVVITENPEIGKEFTVQLTITNLTNKNIKLKDVYSSVFAGTHYFNAESKILSSVTLRAKETITCEITGKIEDDADWYQKDGTYYVNFRPNVGYYLFFNGTYFLDSGDESISLKINNLHVGNENIALEWADNIDNIYYMKSYTKWNFGENPNEYYGREIDAEIFKTNLSEVTIDELASRETISTNSISSSSGLSLERIEDTESFDYDYMFQIEDNYYISAIYREYKTVILDIPKIDLSYSLEKSDTQEDIYKFTATNNSDNVIENFVFTTDSLINQTTDEKYYQYGALNSNDKWNIDVPLSINTQDDYIVVGYLIDGLFYLWSLDIDFANNESTENVDDLLLFHSYALKLVPDEPDEADDVKTSETNQSSSNSEADISEFFERSVLNNLDIDYNNSSGNMGIKIISRHGGRTWLYAVLSVVVLAAAAVSVWLIKKSKKENQKE